jgi:hypothetical protein
MTTEPAHIVLLVVALVLLADLAGLAVFAAVMAHWDRKARREREARR